MSEHSQFVAQPPPNVETRQLKIYKNDVENFGPTDGCGACRSIVARGHSRGHNHIAACRVSLEAKLAESETGQHQLDMAGSRMTESIVK